MTSGELTRHQSTYWNTLLNGLVPLCFQVLAGLSPSSSLVGSSAMSSEQRKSTASTYATPAIIGVSALAIIGAGYYWYNSSSADSRVALLEATQAPASTSRADREEEAAAANESKPQQRQAATTAAKNSHSKAQQVQLPAEIERLPLNTSVSDLTEMLSKSASASQRLSQLALLAAQSAHSTYHA